MFLEFHQERHLPIKTVADIMNIPEPNLVEHHQQEILLGTVVPHQLMATSSPVKQHARMAPETSVQSENFKLVCSSLNKTFPTPSLWVIHLKE